MPGLEFTQQVENHPLNNMGSGGDSLATVESKPSPIAILATSAPSIESPEKYSLATCPECNQSWHFSQNGHYSQTESECLHFIEKKGTYKLAKQQKLRNNLLATVGLLELANACDFAANVWNEIPVPKFAVALMAVGGAFALFIAAFAFVDLRMSWSNINLLKNERNYLKIQKADKMHDGNDVHELDCLLDVHFREFGTEIVDRAAVDILMGFGAVLVGVGTIMAIWGANKRIADASNLLSGYIGNTPAAAWGLGNCVWSLYAWRRALRHRVAGAKALGGNDPVLQMLKRRTLRVQNHAVLNGITGIAAGAASLVTSHHWEGYTVLLPCIFTSVYSNYMLRWKIGYDRLSVQQLPRMDREQLIADLRSVNTTRQALQEAGSTSLLNLVADPQCLLSIIGFILENGLFEEYCTRLLKDRWMQEHFFGNRTELDIDSTSLLTADEPHVRCLLKTDEPRYRCLLEVAQSCVAAGNPTHLDHRERFLLERLGCCLCIDEASALKVENEKLPMTPVE